MTVVSDASPLILLARVHCLDLIPTLYGRVTISTEVYNEVVIAGAGLPGATQAAQAKWIDVASIQDPASLAVAIKKTGLGTGELSAIILANELAADLIFIDEWKARRYATTEGLSVIGCIGLLENLYRKGHLVDLREAYLRLLTQKTRIDLHTLQQSLANLNLPPL